MDQTHKKKDRPAVQAELKREPVVSPASDLGGLTGDGHANPASDLTEREDELAAKLTAAEAVVAELEAKLKDAEAKAADHLDSWRRAQADLDNFRRRVERDRDDLAKFAAQNFILRLLPVLDNLDLAKKSAENPLFKEIVASQKAFAERAVKWDQDTYVSRRMAVAHFFGAKPAAPKKT
jgi:molecular chaperone GrpE (heat shock protein)